MSGVMPLPAERKRYLAATGARSVNPPRGALTRSRAPGAIVSCSQFDTGPPVTRFTVIDRRCGRVGGEEIV